METFKPGTLSRWKTIFSRETYAPDRASVEFCGDDIMDEVDYRVTFRVQSIRIRIRAELHGFAVFVAIYHEDESGKLSRVLSAPTQILAANGIETETQRKILLHVLRLAHYQRYDARHGEYVNEVTRILDRETTRRGVDQALKGASPDA